MLGAGLLRWRGLLFENGSAGSPVYRQSHASVGALQSLQQRTAQDPRLVIGMRIGGRLGFGGRDCV